MITNLDQLDRKGYYTYSDYILWQFKERVELFKGRLFPMAAPNVKHQTISYNLSGLLWTQLKDKPCRAFTAPFDVRLPLPKSKATEAKVDTVVQPDLCVICDQNKLDKQGCIGAPDLVVEILSPGNSKREMKDKLELYQEAGVLEYWVVDPERSSVFVHYMDMKTGKFVVQLPHLTDEDILVSRTLEDVRISLSEVFPEEDTK